MGVIILDVNSGPFLLESLCHYRVRVCSKNRHTKVLGGNMIRIQKSMRLVACITVALFVTACSIDPYTGEEKASNTAKGAGWGALGGAILGAAVSDKDHREQGAWIGAAAGAAAGGW